MTAFQDVQATEWRDVAIGEIPEAIVYRDQQERSPAPSPSPSA